VSGRARGGRAVAVTFLHAYTFRRHEEQAGALCREIGFEQVSLSSEVMPMVKAVPRGLTSCADAYLTPSIQRYLTTFRVGFDAGLKDLELLFMQSDGGLVRVDRFNGFRAILSGPAGGGHCTIAPRPSCRAPKPRDMQAALWLRA
jgi:5-oxoprolinase (ATP-hydrolysing)